MDILCSCIYISIIVVKLPRWLVRCIRFRLGRRGWLHVEYPASKMKTLCKPIREGNKK